MASRKYKISTVSICYNNLDEMIRTCASVDRQLQKPDEHLIINGSDTPEVDEYLRSVKHPPYRRWGNVVNGHISGNYNEGIKRSSVDIIDVVYSGDEYYGERAIEIVSKAFEEDDTLMWTHGNYVQFRGGAWVETGRAFNPKLIYRGMGVTGQPTMFVKREVYERVGLYDRTRKIALDYDMVVRLADEKFKYINYPIIRFFPGGLSTNNQWIGKLEEKEVYKKHKGSSLKMELWFLRSRLLDMFTNTKLGSKIFQIKNKNKELKQS